MRPAGCELSGRCTDAGLSSRHGAVEAESRAGDARAEVKGGGSGERRGGHGMRSEQDILAALRALAESDRDKEASLDVEARLRSGFRKKHAVNVWRRPAVWAMTAAASGVLMMAGFWFE